MRPVGLQGVGQGGGESLGGAGREGPPRSSACHAVARTKLSKHSMAGLVASLTFGAVLSTDMAGMAMKRGSPTSRCSV